MVLGSRGYGSEAVIRPAACPVVVVPRAATQSQGPRPWTALFPQSPTGGQMTDKASTAADARSMRALDRQRMGAAPVLMGSGNPYRPCSA